MGLPLDITGNPSTPESEYIFKRVVINLSLLYNNVSIEKVSF